MDKQFDHPCSLCGFDVHYYLYKVYEHPDLAGVPLCLLCYQRVSETEIPEDEDGLHEACTWCRSGGDLLVCDKCPSAFCKQCLEMDLGPDYVQKASDGDWKCLKCDPAPLKGLQYPGFANDDKEVSDDEEGEDEAKRVTDQLMDIEDELETIQQKMEDEQLQGKRFEIREEMQDIGVSAGEVQEKVEQELAVYVQQLNHHHDILLAMQADLQELCDKLEIDLKQFYLLRAQSKSESSTALDPIHRSEATETGLDALALTYVSKQERENYKIEGEVVLSHPPVEKQTRQEFEEELASLNVTDPIILKHLRRLGIAHDRKIHRYHAIDGSPLPICVCRALSMCDEPKVLEMLTNYFHVEGGNQVRDMGDISEIQKIHAPYDKSESYETDMQYAMECEDSRKSEMFTQAQIQTMLDISTDANDHTKEVTLTYRAATISGTASRKRVITRERQKQIFKRHRIGDSSSSRSTNTKRPTGTETNETADIESSDRISDADINPMGNNIDGADDLSSIGTEPEITHQNKRARKNTSTVKVAPSEPWSCDLCGSNIDPKESPRRYTVNMSSKKLGICESCKGLTISERIILFNKVFKNTPTRAQTQPSSSSPPEDAIPISKPNSAPIPPDHGPKETVIDLSNDDALPSLRSILSPENKPKSSDKKRKSSKPINARQTSIEQLWNRAVESHSNPNPNSKTNPNPTSSDEDVCELYDSADEFEQPVKNTKRASYSTGTLKEIKAEKTRVQRLSLMKSYEDTVDGFVLNDMRPEGEPAITAPVQLSRLLKDHQKEGLRFMWQNVVGCLDDFQNGKKEFGCILAHSMGLGKTIQVVVLVITLLTNPNIPNLSYSESSYPESSKDNQVSKPEPSKFFRRILVVAPVNTIENWKREFEQWMSHIDGPQRRMIRVQIIRGDKMTREGVVKTWYEDYGVLIIGYPLFTKLSKIQKTSQILKADLVILDEAHMVKNRKAISTKAVQSIVTHRRIALTGSPLQNNLEEYFCMVDFVRPGYLGKYSEFNRRFQIPIQEGQLKDSTKASIQRAKGRAHVLHKRLSSLVHRRDVRILERELPPKTECVLYVCMSPFQRKLYREYIGLLAQAKTKLLYFAAYVSLQRVWNHPGMLVIKDSGRSTKSTVTLRTIISGLKPTYFHFKQTITLAPTVTDAARSSDEAVNLQKMIQVHNKQQKDRLDGDDVEDDVSYDLLEDDADDLSDFIADDNDDSGNKDCVIIDDEDDVRPNCEADASDLSDQVLHEKQDAIPYLSDENESEEVDVVKSSSSDNTPRVDADVEDDPPSAYEDRGDERGELPEDGKDPSLGEAAEVPIDWWKKSEPQGLGSLNLPEMDDDLMLELVHVGPKLVVMLELVAQAIAVHNDKVVVFSTSLSMLDFIEAVFKTDWYKYVKTDTTMGRSNKCGIHAPFRNWREGHEYVRIDGSVASKTRQVKIDSFNSTKSNASVFLISTKAGNMGVNLVGANRVIIFDTSMNPASDLQAMFRCYRYGQTKPVYVYRLVSATTEEERTFKKAVLKASMAARVVDKIEPDRQFNADEIAKMFELENETQEEEEMAEAVRSDAALGFVLANHSKMINAIKDHERLLEDKPEEKLSKEEQALAEADYDNESKPHVMPVPMPIPPTSSGMNQVISNAINSVNIHQNARPQVASSSSASMTTAQQLQMRLAQASMAASQHTSKYGMDQLSAISSLAEPSAISHWPGLGLGAEAATLGATRPTPQQQLTDVQEWALRRMLGGTLPSTT